MLFDTVAPQTERFTPLTEASGDARRALALTGYRPDGSQNVLGKIVSWVPGAGIIQNAQAQRIAQNAGLTQVAENIGDDRDNRMGKLRAQLGIIQGLAGAFTGNPQMALSGFQNTVQGVGGTLAAGKARIIPTTDIVNYTDGRDTSENKADHARTGAVSQSG